MLDPLETLLLARGWQPGRRVDVGGQRACLVAEGYSVVPSVLSFLAEFGGLSLRGPSDHDVTIDACVAVRHTWRSHLRYWSARTGRELYPVGMTSNNHATVVCSANLEAYVGFEDELSAIGCIPREALSTLLLTRAFSPVPELEGYTASDFIREDDP